MDCMEFSIMRFSRLSSPCRSWMEKKEVRKGKTGIKEEMGDKRIQIKPMRVNQKRRKKELNQVQYIQVL